MKRTTFDECVCGATKSGVCEANHVPGVFVARHKVVCMKRTTFPEHVCGATKSGINETNYHERVNGASAHLSGKPSIRHSAPRSEVAFEENIVLPVLLLKKLKKGSVCVWIGPLLSSRRKLDPFDTIFITCLYSPYRSTMKT
jgi:hypothetical protein